MKPRLIVILAASLLLPGYAWAANWGKRIFDETNPQGNVEVYEKPLGPTRFMVEDKLLRAWTSDGASRRAHLSFITARRPVKKALVIGPGAGAAVDAAFFHGAEAVTVALKNPSGVKAAAAFDRGFGKAMKNPKTKVEILGANGWAGALAGKYDAIILWAAVFSPDEVYSSMTVENFTELKKSLNPGGVAALWIPLGFYEPARTKEILATFAAVFPEVTVWLDGINPQLGWAVAMGSEEPGLIDVAQAQERLKRTKEVYNLDEKGNAASLLSNYVTDHAGLAAALKGAAPRKKADKSKKATLPPWDKVVGHSEDNFRMLAGLRTPVTGKTNATGAEAERLDKYFQARTLILKALLDKDSGSTVKQMELYSSAFKLAQDDPILALRYLAIGRMMTEMDMPDRGVTILETAKQIDPVSAEIRYALGKTYEKMNKSVQATAEYNKMQELDPGFLKRVTDIEMGAPSVSKPTKRTK